MHATAVSGQDFIWLIGSLCQINRIPFDPQLILQRFPAPHTVRDFLEAARSLGFKTGEGDLGKPKFPCVGFLKGEAPKPALMVKGDAERLLYFAAGLIVLAVVLMILFFVTTLVRGRSGKKKAAT